MSLRRALVTLTVPLAVCLSLTACGDDSPAPAAAPQSSSAATSSETTGSGTVVDDLSEALGEDASVDAALDALGEDGVVKALGSALTTVLSDASGYTLDDGRLIVTMDGDRANSETHCILATVARDGIGAQTEITLRYPDGDVDCD